MKKVENSFSVIRKMFIEYLFLSVTCTRKLQYIIYNKYNLHRKLLKPDKGNEVPPNFTGEVHASGRKRWM